MTYTKKFTPNKFKTNRKQHQPRPIVKNVDPFSRRPQQTDRPVREVHKQPTNNLDNKSGSRDTNRLVRRARPRRLSPRAQRLLRRKQLFRRRQ